MPNLDTQRHFDVFDAGTFGDRRVDVIGLGAVGSHVGILLAKLGIENLHIWDDDKIEEHNIANQVYNLVDVGRQKTNALHSHILKATGLKTCKHKEFVDGSQELGEVVFVLTDSMTCREQIWNSVKLDKNIGILIETRMGANAGYVYCVNPNSPVHISKYENSFYEDIGEATACRAIPTVGATGILVAALAVWQLIKWFKCEQGQGEEPEGETLVSLEPFLFHTTNFS